MNNDVNEKSSIPEKFVGEKEWFFLYWIAYYKYLNDIPISTPELCRKIPLSQQTISRRIIELEKEGYIVRSFQMRGGALDITPKGYSQLEIISKNLQSIFSNQKISDIFHGVLKKGMGEGAYYIQHPKYLNQFDKKLGFKPYFGTLNVHLENYSYEILQKYLTNTPEVTVNGFHDGTRAYGDVKCYQVLIWTKDKEERKIHGALLKINRTSHKAHILEFIAEFYIRDYFQIDDDDEIYFQFIQNI